MAFTVSCEPSEALLRAMEARVSRRTSTGADHHVSSVIYSEPAPSRCMDAEPSFSSKAAPREASSLEGAAPAFKISGPPPMSSAPIIKPDELQHLLAGGGSTAYACPIPSRIPGAPCPAPVPISLSRPADLPSGRHAASGSRQPPSASSSHPPLARHAPQSESPRYSHPAQAAPKRGPRSASPRCSPAVPSELRRPKAASENQPFDVSSVRSARSPAQPSGALPPELAKAMAFLDNRHPSVAASSSRTKPEPPRESVARDEDNEDEPDEPGASPMASPYDDSDSQAAQDTNLVEIGGNAFAEVEPDAAVHIPSVVTFAGVPAAMDGDLVYLGGGLYANTASAAPAKRPPLAPKKRVMPGRVNPGKQAAISGAPRMARSSSQPPPSRDDHLFYHDSDRQSEATPKSSGPPAWRPAGAAKRPSLASGLSAAALQEQQQQASGECSMPIAAPRRPPDGAPTNMDSRVREREEIRREGCTLFGRQGVLREIAEMQQMPLLAPTAPKKAHTGGPLPSEIRAAERKAAKEAKIQAILEEREEYEKIASEKRALRASASAPALSNAGLNMGLGMTTPFLPPDEAERLKLRVACKMETLSFLNGYHSAVGKMSMEQKAALLAKLHSSKEVKPTHVPVATPSEEFSWPEQLDHQPSVHQRLQQMNDMCNEAFDFDVDV